MSDPSTRAWSPPSRSPWRYLASWPSPPGCPWSEVCPRPKPGTGPAVQVCRPGLRVERECALLDAMEVSWLCPDMAERFGSDAAAWPTRVAAKQGISTTTVVERWAAGFNYVLDLANEARQLLPHLQSLSFALQQCHGSSGVE